jgi:hypothetical protein
LLKFYLIFSVHIWKWKKKLVGGQKKSANRPIANKDKFLCVLWRTKRKAAKKEEKFFSLVSFDVDLR